MLRCEEQIGRDSFSAWTSDMGFGSALVAKYARIACQASVNKVKVISLKQYKNNNKHTHLDM